MNTGTFVCNQRDTKLTSDEPMMNLLCTSIRTGNPFYQLRVIKQIGVRTSIGLEISVI